MKLTVRLAIILAVFISLSWSKAALGDGPDEREPVLKRSDVYCTGFISDVAPSTSLKIVGGDRENMQDTYTEGQVVFLNKGREQGIQPGAVYYVIRPLGTVKHPFTKKRVGHFVRELGTLRVVEVQASTAVAEILVSCDQILVGDLLKPYEEQKAPAHREARPLPRFGEGSGGVNGQIIMSPELREYFSANNVVYIDLGDRQGVQSGDYFTIYRKIARNERIAHMPKDNIVQERSRGYQSGHYRGGTFSQEGSHEPRDKVLRARPEIPRKVLGELIVLKVENNTAVALITRTTAEVNIGDWVEKSN